jgi:hypothetical protein
MPKSSRKTKNNGAVGAFRRDKDLSGYVTKYDFLQTEVALRKDIHALETTMYQQLAKLKDELKAENTSNFRWFVGTVIAMGAVIVGLLKNWN